MSSPPCRKQIEIARARANGAHRAHERSGLSSTGGEQLRADRKRLEELEDLLLEKFARWETLEEQRAQSA